MPTRKAAEMYMRTLWRLLPGEDSPVPDPEADPEGWESDLRIIARSECSSRERMEATIQALQAALSVLP